jgi:hypothetical protein
MSFAWPVNDVKREVLDEHGPARMLPNQVISLHQPRQRLMICD